MKDLQKKSGCLYQVSLLQALAYGDYYGSVPVEELLRHGDTGIGTFDKLNGELILLDGVVYRAGGDGRAEVVSQEETIPFAVATFLEADDRQTLENIPTFEALTRQLDALVAQRGVNRFYMIRIDGHFRSINVRSVYGQKEPYRRLTDVLTQEQTFFDHENVEGTMVGLYCPPYMSDLNAVGWHMHFITKDKTQGGHVLGVDILNAHLTFRGMDSFTVKLPQTQRFSAFDLTVDQSADIEKIEKNT